MTSFRSRLSFPSPRPRFRASILVSFALSFGVAIAVRPAAAAEQHLARHPKPLGPGERPSALPAYGERLGVPARSDADRQFDRIVDDYLLYQFRNQPVRATNVGIHDFDDFLPATDRIGIETSISDLEGYLARLSKLEIAHLGRERRFDHAMLTSRLRGTLLDLQTIQPWKHDPNFYLSIASGGIHALLKRDFAPLEDRVWNVVARLTEIPRVFSDARANLENPPQAYTEIAIAQSAGVVHFLADQVPAGVASIRDPVLRQEFDHHLAAAVGAANDFHDWLKTDLLPRSQGDFALGADTYAKKLLYDEMVATPLDSLYRHGEAALHETQRRMEKEANAIEPGLSVQDALARLARDAPSARSLVPAAEAKLGKIRSFVAEHGILTPPEHEDLRVAETPVFHRSLSFASMD